MKITELLLAEPDREAVGIRKTLERVPEGKNDWKPHEKSRGGDHDRTMENTLQHATTTLVTRLQATGTAGQTINPTHRFWLWSRLSNRLVQKIGQVRSRTPVPFRTE